jgi:hypothetical protein
MPEQTQDPAKPYWDEQQYQLMLEHDRRAQSLLAPAGSQGPETKRNESKYMGNFLEGLGTILLVLTIFGIFGIWKLVEIIIWLFTNVSISF